jgi:hypothetical protein
LGQALDKAKADENLIDIIYDLLIKRKYRLAEDIAFFGTQTLKSHSSDQTRRILVVNLAIAYKFGSHPKKCASVLKGEDWSATSDDYNIVIAALDDDFEQAAKLMKLMGKDKKLGKLEYCEWPAFRDFRKSDQFANAYKEIFGEDFTIKAKEPKATEVSQDTAKKENVLGEE